MITRALFPLVRVWKVFILTRARNSLTKRRPMHPDLPEVVLALHWWENAGERQEPPTAVVRWCEHGEDVRAGETSRGCSGCVNGICGAALACELPEPEVRSNGRSFLPTTREGWGRLIGAGLGIGGVVLLGTTEFVRRFFV